MAGFPQLRLLQSLVKVEGDATEDQQEQTERANAQARGEVEPDLARDLPKYVNSSYEGAQGVKELHERFAPKRTDNQVRARLANVDGVAVPDLPIFKTGACPSLRLLQLQKGWDESQHPRHPSGDEKGGQFASSGGGELGAAQFVSANVKEHLTLSDSIRNLGSDRQVWLMELHRDVDTHTGLRAESRPAVGEWPDPSVGQDTENSSMVNIQGQVDWNTMRYNSALKGLHAEQKSVLPFVVDPGGQQTLYRIRVDTTGTDWENDIKQIQGVLDKAGIQFRTFVQLPGQTDVMVYDPDNALETSVRGAAQHMGAAVKTWRGTGEFVGADTREAAAEEYRRIIGEYESKSGKPFELRRKAPVQKAKGSRFGGLTNLRGYALLYVKHANCERQAI